MVTIEPRRRLARLAAGIVVASGLAALTLPTAPATARVFVSVGVPGAWGYYAPPPYYAYPTYYGYAPQPYYRYTYPAGVYFGRPYYWHPYWHGHWGYRHGRWHAGWHHWR